jgi:hypothetical protein
MELPYRQYYFFHMVLIKSPFLFVCIFKIVYNAIPFYFIVFYSFYFTFIFYQSKNKTDAKKKKFQYQNSKTLFPLTVLSLGWTHFSHGIALNEYDTTLYS